MHKKAFTLIELLVVIAIIGILAGILIVSMTSATNSANDARRKSDISTVYKNILVKGLTSSYPISESGFSLDNILSEHSSFFSTFLVPIDPNSNKHYFYRSNASGTDFSVLASLDDGSCFVMSSGVDLFPGASCSGTGYTNMAGTSASPGLSCKDILDGGGSVGSGVYYIDPNGGDISDKFQVYCDMTTDGGGWTLVWKSNASSAVNTSAVNATSLTTLTMDTFAKFSDATINQIKSSTNTNDIGYRIEQSICSPIIVGYISAACVFEFKSGSSTTIPSANCRKGKKLYTDTVWLTDTYQSGVWCSNSSVWASSIMCLSTGAADITLHYSSTHENDCNHSYKGVKVWVK